MNPGAEPKKRKKEYCQWITAITHAAFRLVCPLKLNALRQQEQLAKVVALCRRRFASWA